MSSVQFSSDAAFDLTKFIPKFPPFKSLHEKFTEIYDQLEQLRIRSSKTDYILSHYHMMAQVASKDPAAVANGASAFYTKIAALNSRTFTAEEIKALQEELIARTAPPKFNIAKEIATNLYTKSPILHLITTTPLFSLTSQIAHRLAPRVHPGALFWTMSAVSMSDAFITKKVNKIACGIAIGCAIASLALPPISSPLAAGAASYVAAHTIKYVAHSLLSLL